MFDVRCSMFDVPRFQPLAFSLQPFLVGRVPSHGVPAAARGQTGRRENFLAARERKEHKEKIRIFPIKTPFFPEAVFLCVLCVLLWLNCPAPPFVHFAVKNFWHPWSCPTIRCALLDVGC
jgi:hypothetical protein